MFLHVGDTMDPDEVKVLKSPDNWVEPPTNTAKGEHTFDKVDNPGGWSSFSYRPVFTSGSQGGECKEHCLPAGYQPVPPNEDDGAIRTHGGWNFSTKGGRRGKIRMW